MDSFRRRYFDLAKTYPRLRKGGLSIPQLKDLAERIGRRYGVVVRTLFRPWPWPGSIQRVGSEVVIVVDNRRIAGQQVLTLAHEVGHLALGHYDLEEDGFWTDCDGPISREEEAEADLFASIVLDKLVSPIEHLGGPEQIELIEERL